MSGYRFLLLFLLGACPIFAAEPTENSAELIFEEKLFGWKLNQHDVSNSLAAFLTAQNLSSIRNKHMSQIKLSKYNDVWMVCGGACIPIANMSEEIKTELNKLAETAKREAKSNPAPLDSTKETEPATAETSKTSSGPAREPRAEAKPEEKPAAAKIENKPVLPKSRISTDKIRFVDDPNLGRLVNVGAERTPVPANAVAYVWGDDGKVKWLTAADFSSASDESASEATGTGTHAADESTARSAAPSPAGAPTAASNPPPKNTSPIQTPTGRVSAVTYNGHRSEVPPTATAYYFQNGQIKFVLGNELPTDAMTASTKATKASEPVSMAGMVRLPASEPAPSRPTPRAVASASLPTLNFGSFYCPPCEGVKTLLRTMGIDPNTGRDTDGQQRFYVTHVDTNTAIRKGGVPCAVGSGLPVSVRACHF